MFNSIFQVADQPVIFEFLIALGTALFLGFLTSFLYMKVQKDKVLSENFILALVILPAIITAIIIMVGSNVARAFSLAGIFAIIRFRSAPGNSKDITYVLLSMAVGLACGMGCIAYALILAVLLCGVMTVLELTKYGAKEPQKILKITIPEDLNFSDVFKEVLEKHTAYYKLCRIRTAELGSLYQLQYAVRLRQNTSEKALIDDLRCHNGNLNITMVLDAAGSDVSSLF
jgi:Zn-dependent protease with chaperone function